MIRRKLRRGLPVSNLGNLTPPLIIRLALIFKGDGLAEILAACAGRFGAVALRPIHPRAEAPAHRLLVTAVKGSRARPSILPGLVLHPAEGNTYLAEADAVLRGRRDLA